MTLLLELQKGQLKAMSSLGRCFFGGGLLLFRFPMRSGEHQATASGALRPARTRCYVEQALGSELMRVCTAGAWPECEPCFGPQKLGVQSHRLHLHLFRLVTFSQQAQHELCIYVGPVHKPGQTCELQMAKYNVKICPAHACSQKVHQRPHAKE